MSIFQSLRDLLLGPRLRCKPGQRCMVIRQCQVYAFGTQALVPRMGTCCRVVRHTEGLWQLEDPIRFSLATPLGTAQFWIDAIADDMLWPLRELGSGEGAWVDTAPAMPHKEVTPEVARAPA